MCGMSTVAEIKAAIDRLSPEERCELEALLHPREDDDWDRQMKQDATAGKFAAMNHEADEAHKKGETIPLSDILHEP
jgi:hypothetical protein